MTSTKSYSPTISDGDILVLSASVPMDGPDIVGPESSYFFVDRCNRRFPGNDWSQRPIWQHEDAEGTEDAVESFVQFEPKNGWVLFLNTGSTLIQ